LLSPLILISVKWIFFSASKVLKEEIRNSVITLLSFGRRKKSKSFYIPVIIA